MSGRGYSVMEMAHDLERLATHPVWEQIEQRAAADEAVGGVVAYEKYNDVINERINFQIELADTRKAADTLAEALKLAHGCLREVRRDFDAPINGVIDEVYDALVAYHRAAGDATRDATG